MPAAAPAAASQRMRARPSLVHAPRKAPIVTATRHANQGSSVVTVPSTMGMTVVACTMKARGPSSRRPVMRAAHQAATSAAPHAASALGSRMATAFCPKAEMLVAVIQ